MALAHDVVTGGAAIEPEHRNPGAGVAASALRSSSWWASFHHLRKGSEIGGTGENTYPLLRDVPLHMYRSPSTCGPTG